jgi:hypothetical protein
MVKITANDFFTILSDPDVKAENFRNFNEGKVNAVDSKIKEMTENMNKKFDEPYASVPTLRTEFLVKDRVMASRRLKSQMQAVTIFSSGETIGLLLVSS